MKWKGGHLSNQDFLEQSDPKCERKKVGRDAIVASVVVSDLCIEIHMTAA